MTDNITDNIKETQNHFLILNTPQIILIMTKFNVPTRDEVSEKNQSIFDTLEKNIGFVPNIYATYAYSENALQNYLNLSDFKTSLSAKEKKAISLVVSEVNQCEYCLSAHTTFGKMNGFNDAEILELRAGKSSFNPKLNALVALAKNITENRGAVDETIMGNFFNAGYTKENLVDIIVLIGDKTISNYLHKITDIPIDFPKAQSLNGIEN